MMSNDNQKPGAPSPMSTSPMSPSPMSCAEFQQQLPDLFAAGDDRIAEESPLRQHLETCENCSALVRDLQYIAQQASLLLQPVDEEPSDDVWKKIEKSLVSERIIDEEALKGDSN